MSKRHVHPVSNLKPLSYVSPKMSLTLSPPSTLGRFLPLLLAAAMTAAAIFYVVHRMAVPPVGW
jgi:hypothetical protein